MDNGRESPARNHVHELRMRRVGVPPVRPVQTKRLQWRRLQMAANLFGCHAE